MRLVFLMVLLLPAFASAQAPAAACVPSPSFAPDYYPGIRNIPTSNDLTRFNGKAVAASGQKLLVQVRLRDSRCVPIQGAVVELWQRDPFGQLRLLGREDRVNQRPTFSGAGRSYSGNNGEVQFLTVFPAPAKGTAPHVHLRIKAPGMKVFTTALYFENDVRNATDREIRRLSPAARNRVELRMSPMRDPNAGLIGAAEIIVPGKSRYRTY